jgi:YHS domain-containing protein
MLLGWIIRLLLVVLLIRAVLNFFSGVFRGVAGPKKTSSNNRLHLVKDPVCGTYIDPSRSYSKKIGATIHYFCSENCRETFCA